MFFYNPTKMCAKVLEYAKVSVLAKWTDARKQKEFHALYGSNPLDVAQCWNNLLEKGDELLEPCDVMSKREKKSGLRNFLMAMHFLWAYPRNAKELGGKFDVSENYAKGNLFWKWVRRIASLSGIKIVWGAELDDPNGSSNAVWIDCADMPTWEVKHPTLPKDTGWCSHKHARCAVKYQITLAVHSPKIVNISGPHRGGESDKTVLELSGVLEKLQEGKLAVCDKGYIDRKLAHKLSWPNPHDAPDTNEYKSRIRMRGETINGRMKFFKILRECYRHKIEYHNDVYMAVAVMVQYQMDNGAPIFAV